MKTPTPMTKSPRLVAQEALRLAKDALLAYTPARVVEGRGGGISYTAYDDLTGAVVKTITDVDTTQTGTFANLPGGWSTPAGAGLHLTTTYEVDALGR